MRKGVYGSVQIIIQDGKITQVNDNCSFNATAFVQLCDKLPNSATRFVVKTYDDSNKEDGKNNGETVLNSEQNGDNLNSIDKELAEKG